MPTVQVGILCNSGVNLQVFFSNILSSSRTNLVPGTTLISTRKPVIKAYVLCYEHVQAFSKNNSQQGT
jgi:hypothetical protein